MTLEHVAVWAVVAYGALSAVSAVFGGLASHLPEMKFLGTIASVAGTVALDAQKIAAAITAKKEDQL